MCARQVPWIAALTTYFSYAILFVFGTLREPILRPVFGFGPHARTLSTHMQRAWIEFARTGDPNGGDDPVWPKYQAESDEHLVFDLAISAGSKLRAEKCDFWAELGR